MLKDSNAVMARAAQGAMPTPEATQITRQQGQLKVMKNFLFKVSHNPNSRSRPEDYTVLKEAIKSFGSRQVKSNALRWKLYEIISSLYNHQLVGASWINRQEFSPHGPYGGVLGDQMGLGKTVQILAAMSENRPTEADKKAGLHQTLIVAPASAISQWEREIGKHCDTKFISTVHHYKTRDKLKLKMLQEADIM